MLAGFFLAVFIAVAATLPPQHAEAQRTPGRVFTRTIGDPVSPMVQVCGQVTTPGPEKGAVYCDRPFDLRDTPYPRKTTITDR